MNTKRFVLVLAAGAVGVIGIAGAGVALADDGVPGFGHHGAMMRDGTGPNGAGPMGAGQMGARHDQMQQAAAKALGMTVDELNTQLAAGKALPQIAADRGVDFATVQAAMQAQRPAGARGMGASGMADCPYADAD